MVIKGIKNHYKEKTKYCKVCQITKKSSPGPIFLGIVRIYAGFPKKANNTSMRDDSKDKKEDHTAVEEMPTIPFIGKNDFCCSP